MATCEYQGCNRDAVDGRMFCSKHLKEYGTSDVPSFRKGTESVTGDSESTEKGDSLGGESKE